MATTPAEMFDAALTLENDGDFHREYKGRSLDASNRRNCIKAHLRRLGRPAIDQPAREQVRRYMDEVWQMVPATRNVETHPTIEFWKDEVRNRAVGMKPEMVVPYGGLQHTGVVLDEAVSITPEVATWPFAFPIPSPLEQPTMNIIDITTKTLVNGVDVAGMTDAAIYNLIAEQEKTISDLEAIKNKPKKLVAEIAKRKAGIQALVDFLDSKEEAPAAADTSAK